MFPRKIISTLNSEFQEHLFFQIFSHEICWKFLRYKKKYYFITLVCNYQYRFFIKCLIFLLDFFFHLQKLFWAVNEVPMQTNVTNIKLANRIQQTAQVINIICFGTVTFPSATLSSLLGTSICFQLLWNWISWLSSKAPSQFAYLCYHFRFSEHTVDYHTICTKILTSKHKLKMKL